MACYHVAPSHSLNQQTSVSYGITDLGHKCSICWVIPSYQLNPCFVIICYYQQDESMEMPTSSVTPIPKKYPLPRGHIVLVFQGILSTPIPSLSFHDNGASHSRDTIWTWKFKVKGQGQRYPSQGSVQLTHFLSVSHQGVLWSYRLLYLSFHDNHASYSGVSEWVIKFNGLSGTADSKVKNQP